MKYKSKIESCGKLYSPVIELPRVTNLLVEMSGPATSFGESIFDIYLLLSKMESQLLRIKEEKDLGNALMSILPVLDTIESNLNKRNTSGAALTVNFFLNQVIDAATTV